MTDLAGAPTADPGDDAALAAALFAVDPAGLGGVVLRGGPGPERDGWLARLRALLPTGAPLGRAPLGLADDRLLGGLDLPATLAAGRPVVARGVLAAHDGGVVVLPSAERLDEAAAARIAAVLDAGEVVLEREGVAARLPARLGLVLLDEGREPEEHPPAALLERLAFPAVDLAAGPPPSFAGSALLSTPAHPHAFGDPDLFRARALEDDIAKLGPRRRGDEREGRRTVDIAAARAALTNVETPDAAMEALCATAVALGIAAPRADVLAARAARAHAALSGRDRVGDADVEAAVRLVLLPRARALPDAEAPEPPPPETDTASRAESETPSDTPQREAAERVLEAVRAALPAGLLEDIVARNARAARVTRRGGAGAAARAAQRGRPAGSRGGTLRPGDRLDLPATLRAAAPWRRLRAGAPDGRLPVRASDFRIRRFVQRRESTAVFVVDASGSAALQRLAEAKGAVELLLARAYVTRARVALVAFRGEGAEVLLAPTRSLTLARRRLADLPGGGGTPLADGLDAALALALGERARDRTPLLVVLTDGRANVGRAGTPGRAAAERDALAAAARIGEAGVGAAWLDVSPRPQPGGDRFARAMGAVYTPLPHADAGRVSALVDGLRARG